MGVVASEASRSQASKESYWPTLIGSSCQPEGFSCTSQPSSCSCKEKDGFASIFGKLSRPWSSRVDSEESSGEEETDSLEWKPPVMGSDGSRYTGQWKGGHWHGEGQLERADGSVYEGGFKDGKPHGQGRLQAPDGSVYEGQWRQGRAHGEGQYTKAGGAGNYEGQWLEDKRSGKGSEQWAGPPKPSKN